MTRCNLSVTDFGAPANSIYNNDTESEALPSLGGQHGKGVDGQFEKMNFQTEFEGVRCG